MVRTIIYVSVVAVAMQFVFMPAAPVADACCRVRVNRWYEMGYDRINLATGREYWFVLVERRDHELVYDSNFMTKEAAEQRVKALRAATGRLVFARKVGGASRGVAARVEESAKWRGAAGEKGLRIQFIAGRVLYDFPSHSSRSVQWQKSGGVRWIYNYLLISVDRGQLIVNGLRYGTMAAGDYVRVETNGIVNVNGKRRDVLWHSPRSPEKT